MCKAQLESRAESVGGTHFLCAGTSRLVNWGNRFYESNLPGSYLIMGIYLPGEYLLQIILFYTEFITLLILIPGVIRFSEWSQHMWIRTYV